MDIRQIINLATFVADFEQDRRTREHNLPMTELEYGALIANLLLPLMERSKDPKLMGIAQRFREIGVPNKEKK